MAHNLTVRENGFVEMAFEGNRSNIWHGLGTALERGASIEVWEKAAGLDWTIYESPIYFHDKIGDAVAGLAPTAIFPKRKALYRSDSKRPLAIVGSDFKVIQPIDILEFFRDLIDLHGMTLSTAGSLFGGTKFWALAELGKDTSLFDVDEVKGYLLLVTGVDGMSTVAKYVSIRVVCNNTLSISLNEHSKNLIKKTHRTEWDPRSVKIDLGLIDKGWDNFIKNINSLSNAKMSRAQTVSFYRELFSDESGEQSRAVTRKIDKIMHLYDYGDGAAYGYGTAWGALNAVTNLFTHGSGRKSASSMFWDSNFGTAEKIKIQAMSKLLELA